MYRIAKRMRISKGWIVAISALLVASCASGTRSNSPSSKSNNGWTIRTLTAALAKSSRPQSDRDRDVDRKPAELMVFFGVERGMKVIDLIAGRGYVTEVLATAVGPTGKVYSQNEGFEKVRDAQFANNRLPNVERVDGRVIPTPPNSVDFVITVMNLHDLYNIDPNFTQAALKYFYGLVKPGGAFGVVDHVGIAGADNAKLHRMTKQQAIDVVTAAGFVLEAESNMLAHLSDDHTKLVTDPSVRGKTDQFVLKFRKPVQ